MRAVRRGVYIIIFARREQWRYYTRITSSMR